MSGTGKRMTWGVVVASDRPRDVLGFSEETEALVTQVQAFASKDQAGNSVVIPRIIWGDDAAPSDFGEFADCPVGTVIETPLVASIYGYQKIAKSADDATDWNKIAKTTV